MSTGISHFLDPNQNPDSNHNATLHKSKQNPCVYLTGSLGSARGAPLPQLLSPELCDSSRPSHLTPNRCTSERVLSSSTFKTYTRLTSPHRALLPSDSSQSPCPHRPRRFQAWLLLLCSPHCSPFSAQQPGCVWQGARGSSFLLLGNFRGFTFPLGWSLALQPPQPGPLPHTPPGPLCPSRPDAPPVLALGLSQAPCRARSLPRHLHGLLPCSVRSPLKCQLAREALPPALRPPLPSLCLPTPDASYQLSRSSDLFFWLLSVFPLEFE